MLLISFFPTNSVLPEGGGVRVTHLIAVQALGPRDGGAASGGVSGPGVVLGREYGPCSIGLAPERCNSVSWAWI